MALSLRDAKATTRIRAPSSARMLEVIRSASRGCYLCRYLEFIQRSELSQDRETRVAIKEVELDREASLERSLNRVSRNEISASRGRSR